MESKLMPCPFCGKEWIIKNADERHDRPACKWTAKVFCAHCFGSAGTHGFCWTKEEAEKEAIKAWNRRVTANDK